jgi:TonB family protein
MALHLGVAPRAPQATGPNAPINVKAGIMAGQIVTKVNPVYPPDAKAAKVQGAVVLNAVIAKDGTVQDLSVVSGPEELQRSAMDAVRQWVYKPYLLNGNPTEVETKITITYSLAN